MTRASFSSRDRRAVFWGVAVLAPALLYQGTVKYIDALRDIRARVTNERSALARERALLALAPRQGTMQHALDSVVSASREQLFDAPDDGIAAAEVGAYLARVARKHNVWLRAADPRESKAPLSGIRALPVDIQAESDFEGLRSFLQAMEQGPKLLRVDGLNITPGTDTSASRPVLQLRAVVTGYALRSATAGAPASRTTSTPSASVRPRSDRP